MRAFFRNLGKALTAPWVLALALTLLLVLIIWFLGPYVAIADHKILESVVSRLTATLALVFLWGIFVAVFYSRRRKKELADPGKAAAAEQREQSRTLEREERDYIRDKIKQAVRIVTRSNFYGSGSRSRYSLPWFLVIGPENYGKTSFLLNSGLQFPLNEQADRHLYQLKATERCETMFANQAVFIDTPGNYADSRRETRQNGLWQLLLKRLFRAHPAKPANGVLVCVSIRDIMDDDAVRREHLARAIRERLSETLQMLRTHVPVFLVFTKCDVVPGFAQFFAQLPRAEREQIFGCPAGSGLSMDMSKLRAETAEMLQTLNAQIISKIHQERDLTARGDIFVFPQELAALAPRIEDFIAEAFGPSRYHRPVMFRGFFFTSALSSQDVLKSAARGGELAFQTGFQPSQGDYVKGFFILKLLQDRVIPEASLAGADKEHIWSLRLRRHGLQLAAGALFLPLGIKLSPMLGSAAMSLSSVCVCLNALRLRFFQDKGAPVTGTAPKPAPTNQEPACPLPAAAAPIENKETTTEGEIVMTKVLTVEGMMCAHCQAHVQKALAGVPGVASAAVDLDSKKATVELSADVADSVLMDAVKEAGYDPTGCTTL